MKKKKFKNLEVEAYLKGTLKQLKYLRSRWIFTQQVKNLSKEKNHL